MMRKQNKNEKWTRRGQFLVSDYFSDYYLLLPLCGGRGRGVVLSVLLIHLLVLLLLRLDLLDLLLLNLNLLLLLHILLSLLRRELVGLTIRTSHTVNNLLLLLCGGLLGILNLLWLLIRDGLQLPSGVVLDLNCRLLLLLTLLLLGLSLSLLLLLKELLDLLWGVLDLLHLLGLGRRLLLSL